MGKFREHGVMLFLSRDLYVAFIKLQADKELGRSFAALLPFTEGLYRMGYISKEIYEDHKKRYSEPLIKEVSKPLTREQLEEKAHLKEKDKLFSMVLAQWHLHPSKEWRLKWFREAEKWKDKLRSAAKVYTLRARA